MLTLGYQHIYTSQHNNLPGSTVITVTNLRTVNHLHTYSLPVSCHAMPIVGGLTNSTPTSGPHKSIATMTSTEGDAAASTARPRASSVPAPPLKSAGHQLSRRM